MESSRSLSRWKGLAVGRNPFKIRIPFNGTDSSGLRISRNQPGLDAQLRLGWLDGCVQVEKVNNHLSSCQYVTPSASHIRFHRIILETFHHTTIFLPLSQRTTRSTIVRAFSDSFLRTSVQRRVRRMAAEGG